MKRILVTGASQGIGRAICGRLATSGVEIAVCAPTHLRELDDVIGDIRVAGGVAHPLVGDLTDPSVPRLLIQEAAEAMGGVDAVVSNAGVTRPAMLASLTDKDWDFVFAVNSRAPAMLASAAYPWLKQSQGSFVAIASMSGIQPYSGMGAYSASKAALIMLVRQIAQEWAGDGIRANCISPGLVRTPLTQGIYDSPEAKSARESLVPIQRIAEADNDIAGIVSFLLSAESTYITGQNLLVDGGLLDSIQAHLSGRPRSVV